VFVLRGVLITIVIVFATSACGSAQQPASTTPAENSDLTIALTRYRFGPADITLPAGDTVTIEVRNFDTLDHDWALLTTTIESEAEFRDDMIAEKIPVKVSAVEQLSFRVPAPGVYQIVCTIGGHISQGMIGTLTAV